MSKKFAEYQNFNLSEINKDVLKKWDANDVFAKSMTEREGCPSFVFFEGPPSANGMPGIHHVMARSIKDIFCRYKTMKGYQVKRKAGWDTHGLPVELGVEKALGITKEDIGKNISVAGYYPVIISKIFTDINTGNEKSTFSLMSYKIIDCFYCTGFGFVVANNVQRICILPRAYEAA